MDDTLMLEEGYVRSGYRAIGLWAASNWSEVPEHVERLLWRLFLTGDRSKVITKWLEASGREDYTQAAVNVYRRHRPSVSLVTGASEVLRTLGDRYKLGLVTDGFSVTQRRKIEALGLETMISTIVISDEIGGRSTWKPSPAPLLEACSRLGTTPGRSVYIADNPHKDFQSAQAAGLASVRLRLSAGLHVACEPECEHAEPDTVISEIHEVPLAVDSLELGPRPTRIPRNSPLTFDQRHDGCAKAKGNCIYRTAVESIATAFAQASPEGSIDDEIAGSSTYVTGSVASSEFDTVVHTK